MFASLNAVLRKLQTCPAKLPAGRASATFLNSFHPRLSDKLHRWDLDQRARLAIDRHRGDPDHPQQPPRKLARPDPDQSPAAKRDATTLTVSATERHQLKHASGNLADCIADQTRTTLLNRITGSIEHQGQDQVIQITGPCMEPALSDSTELASQDSAQQLSQKNP
ncbi:hypothetical protein PTTG_27472 [Puccinia triticina 1-1 BBBD Race 1]|uniref:Uncharacterized protein n=1 Tax=Puccinia triticina (isolate 1-1 / race 1 (BBBD)) TaxID=630390 RepID=A0A180GKB7_PUCT1|nr:hypothetical protein PTTG_27472 [Puccinia triticina 1-1 BBBD Race 1]